MQDDDFPLEDFINAGYKVGFHGQKQYNGVAIISKEAPVDAGAGLGDKAEPDQARLIWGESVWNQYY